MEPRPPRTDPIRQGQDAPYERQVFICTNGPECPSDGPAAEIRAALKDAVKARAAKDRLRITKSGCLGQCGHGPMMVVHPDNVWYSHLDLGAAMEILDVHLLGGPNAAPVETHRFRLGPGGCKAARHADGSSTCAGECQSGPQA